MTKQKIVPTLIGLALSAFSVAAPAESLDGFVRRVLSNSPLATAADRSLAAQTLLAKSLGRPINPVLELAPGIGFTNGNFALSQDFDVFGARTAERRVQQVRITREQRECFLAKAAVSVEALEALYRWRFASESMRLADETVSNAQSLLTSTRKRFQLGEVPEVAVTRAEIAWMQAKNVRATVELDQEKESTLLAAYLGEPPKEADLAVLGSQPIDVSRATVAQSAQALLAETDVLAAEADLTLAKRESKGSVVAGVAADFWSLDRWQSQSSRTLGLQLTYRTTLTDLGENRLRIRSAEEQIQAQKVRLDGHQRMAKLQFQQATLRLQKIGELAERNRQDLLPKGSQMLEAMLKGYDSGILTLTEVLEAQRALYDLKKTELETRLQLRLAELDLLKSTLTVPGLEMNR